MPVASVIHMGTTNGLRYLHCNLCESEWHVVRVKCTNCEQTRDLNYWSLDSENAAVKAESCGDCGTYLKMVYQEKDPKVEPVADDLATLVLDAKWKKKASGAAASTRSCSQGNKPHPFSFFIKKPADVWRVFYCPVCELNSILGDNIL